MEEQCGRREKNHKTIKSKRAVEEKKRVEKGFRSKEWKEMLKELMASQSQDQGISRRCHHNNNNQGLGSKQCYEMSFEVIFPFQNKVQEKKT